MREGLNNRMIELHLQLFSNLTDRGLLLFIIE